MKNKIKSIIAFNINTNNKTNIMNTILLSKTRMDELEKDLLDISDAKYYNTTYRTYTLENLLDKLPLIITKDNVSYKLNIIKHSDCYEICYKSNTNKHYSALHEHLIDCAYNALTFIKTNDFTIND